MATETPRAPRLDKEEIHAGLKHRNHKGHEGTKDTKKKGIRIQATAKNAEVAKTAKDS